MLTREQIARIIEPVGFEEIEANIKADQDYIGQYDPNSEWAQTTGSWTGSWTRLIHNLKYSIAWQAVDRAWDKADKIIEGFENDRPN